MPSTSPPRTLTKFTLFLIVAILGGGIALLLGLPSGPTLEPHSGPTTLLWRPALFRLDLRPVPNGWKVDGEASLPGRGRVPLEITCFDLAEDPFDSKTAFVTDGRVETELGPYPSPMPSGTYTLWVRQKEGVRFPVATYRIGDEATEAREEEERKVHFLRILAGARESIDDLEAAAEAAIQGQRFADPDGRFLADSWRRWLSEAFQPTLDRIDTRQHAYQAAYAVDRYPAASREVGEILDRLQAAAQHFSDEVHRHHGMTPPPGAVAGEGKEGLDGMFESVASRVGIVDRPLPPEDRTDTVEGDGATLTRHRRGKAWTLEVDGAVSLPSGCEYTVDLRFHDDGNAIIASSRATGPEYWIRLSAIDRPLPSGTYILLVRLDYTGQTEEIQRRIDREAPDLREGWRKRIVFTVGTKEEIQEEEKARLDYYQETLKGTARWFWEMRDRLVDASRGEAFTDEHGELDLERLREWNTGIDADLTALQMRHETFRGSTLAAKYESVDRTLDQFLRALGKEKSKGLGALTGRAVIGGSFSVAALIGIEELNSLIRNDVCPAIGLPPVTLGSLRLGEGREAQGSGNRERALDIFRRLGASEGLNRVVVARALLLAADILIEDGREWRALPLLETLASGRRYRGLAAARDAQKRLGEILGGGSAWAIEKQAAYRDDLATTLEGIRQRIGDGRIEAAGHRLEGWAVLERGYHSVFRGRTSDPSILAEMDDLFVSAKEAAALRERCTTFLREALDRFDKIVPVLETGNVEGFRQRMDSDLVPFVDRATTEEGMPEAVAKRILTRIETARARAGALETLQKEIEEKVGIRFVGLTEDKQAVLVALPGQPDPVPVGPGQELARGIYLVEIRDVAGGKMVAIEVTNRGLIPFFLP